MTTGAAFRAAIAVEMLKLRRAVVVHLASVLLVAGVPLASIGAVALARSPHAAGPSAAKLADYATGDLGTAHLAACAQVLSVATLMAGGFALAWAFGRELERGTAGALFGLPVARSTVALAKCVVAAAWLGACVACAVLLSVTASIVVTAAAGSSFAAWPAAGTAVAAGLLSAGLSLPFAWLATVTRSQLGTVGGLVGLVAVTQVVVLLGGGRWFPYAVPSLWAGMGGAEAAAGIGPLQLLLSAAVAPLAAVATVHAWRRLTNV